MTTNKITNISTIFIRTAFRQHPDKAQEVLATANEVADHADAFAELDYNIFRGLAFASGNPIYGLILNGMKGLYTRIGRHYFANPEAKYFGLGKITDDQVTDYAVRKGITKEKAEKWLYPALAEE